MIRKLIERFRPGDSKRTAFRASVMNELIDALNMFLNARPGKGIKLYFADGGLKIELDEFVQKELLLVGDGQGGAGNGEQGPGTLKWRGEWSATVDDYKRNDLVIYKPGTAYGNVDGGAHTGTFVAVKDVPVNYVPNSTSTQYTSVGVYESPKEGAYWKVFSQWGGEGLIIRNTAGNILINLIGSTGTINCDNINVVTNLDAAIGVIDNLTGDSIDCPLAAHHTSIKINADASDNVIDATKGIMLLKKADLPVGKTLKVRQLTFLDAGGLPYTFWALATESA